MIPLPVVRAWRDNVDWPLDEQVEQDLIISRVLVELFSHPDVKDSVVFRGGTALHKIILPEPQRYSEDIDLNRTSSGAVKPLLAAIRDALKDFLGTERRIVSTDNSVKVFYKYSDVNNGTRNLKIEINIRETQPHQPLVRIPYSISSDFFYGSADLILYSIEEMLGTNIRALYQRKKGRDLFDLYCSMRYLEIDWNEVIKSFKMLNVNVSQKEYEANLERKMDDPEFLGDIVPLLPSRVTYDPLDAYRWFLAEVVGKL